METLICNVDPNAQLLMANVVPSSLVFNSAKAGVGCVAANHVGYIVHGQHDVRVSHKTDAFDAASEAPPLTQDSKCKLF